MQHDATLRGHHKAPFETACQDDNTLVGKTCEQLGTNQQKAKELTEPRPPA